MEKSQTVYPSVPQGSGMNEPASLEATGPPGGGSPPNDPNMNNLGKFLNLNLQSSKFVMNFLKSGTISREFGREFGRDLGRNWPQILPKV